jgi:hypothetical protein
LLHFAELALFFAKIQKNVGNACPMAYICLTLHELK